MSTSPLRKLKSAGSGIFRVLICVSALQKESHGGRAAEEQNGADAAEQPAAGGRAETAGAVAGARSVEGKCNNTALQ